MAEWNAGFRSCAEWLAWRVNLDAGAARERVSRPCPGHALPLLSDALARGRLSYIKVRALTRGDTCRRPKPGYWRWGGQVRRRTWWLRQAG